LFLALIDEPFGQLGVAALAGEVGGRFVLVAAEMGVRAVGDEELGEVAAVGCGG
jgi:hypothetical protein